MYICKEEKKNIMCEIALNSSKHCHYTRLSACRAADKFTVSCCTFTRLCTYYTIHIRKGQIQFTRARLSIAHVLYLCLWVAPWKSPVLFMFGQTTLRNLQCIHPEIEGWCWCVFFYSSRFVLLCVRLIYMYAFVCLYAWQNGRNK